MHTVYWRLLYNIEIIAISIIFLFIKHELRMASISGILIAHKHFPCSSILKTLLKSGTPL